MSFLDEEKDLGGKTFIVSDSGSEEPSPNRGEASKPGILGKLLALEATLDKKLGVEAHGPARILPEEKDPKFAKWNYQIVMAL